MKRRPRELSEKEKIRTLDALYTAASTLKGRGAMKRFLRDLLTESERIMLGRRILIARMLLSGESPNDIVRRMGVGLDTVYRIEKWLQDEFPGYEDAIKGMEKDFAIRRDKYEKQEFLSDAWLKKKYPLHFLFFPKPKSRTDRATEWDE
jgi:uncharacterized protein YerC